MISTELKAVFEKSCDSWTVNEANDFCRLLLSAYEQLELRVKSLEDQVATNSSNSSKPPSKDNLRSPKKRSLRQPSGKKPGGQVGHKGTKKRLTDSPDDTVKYEVSECPDCGRDLSEVAADSVIRRQVEDLPPIKTFVVEHQIEVKTCPCCAVQLCSAVASRGLSG